MTKHGLDFDGFQDLVSPADDELEPLPLPAEAATDVEPPVPVAADVPVAEPEPPKAPSSSYREETPEGARRYKLTSKSAYRGGVWDVRTNKYGRSRIKADNREEAERVYREVKCVPDDEKLRDVAATRVR